MDNCYSQFTAQLQTDLQQPLPGRTAQYGMAPRPRPGGAEVDRPRDDARSSGVLLLFYPHGGTICLPLIQRPNYEGVHGGQVSLPGGGREIEDVDLVATALRETHEEIGVTPELIRVLGSLSPLYIRPSNYLVQPTVGWIDHRPRFNVDPREVAELIEAPLPDFLDPQNRHEEVWELRDRIADVPFFRIRDHIVWGATAMIMNEALALPAVQAILAHLQG